MGRVGEPRVRVRWQADPAGCHRQTKTVVKDKFRDLRREIESGVQTRASYTVAERLDDWLTQARGNLPERTREADGFSADLIRERVGKARLRDLSAQHVLAALNGMIADYSTRTIQPAHNALTRAIRHAQAHHRVGRNVSELVDTPRGRIGRPTRSFNLEQTRALLAAAQKFPRDARVHRGEPPHRSAARGSPCAALARR